MEYYIYITNDCNLNCSYCSVLLERNKTNIPLNINYSLDDLKKFIDTIQSDISTDENAVIYFFGGEPTLNYDMIYKIIKKFDCVTDYKITYVLHTNGLLLDNIPSHIIAHIDVMFLSLNYEKIFSSGQISTYFSNIVHSINTIKSKKNIPIIGRLTLSENTSLYSECSLSGLFFDYIYWQLDNQKDIGNIISYKNQYIHDIKILFEYWLSFLKQGVVLRYVPFLGILRNYINNPPIPDHFYCGYGNDIIYIQTDGTCYACCDEVETKRHMVGTIYDGIKFIDMDIKNTICQSCKYLKICGGRCGKMHKDFDEDRIRHYCDMNIYLFELIKSSLDEINQLIESNPSLLDAINDPVLDYTELIP